MLILRLVAVLAVCYVTAALAIYLMTGNRNLLRSLSQGTLILLLVLLLMGIVSLVGRFFGPLL
ncbi:MAG: hypothetical protein G8345_10055 [Magnetococcales bacterium]|nr:hypothetical protein [Magnetococcales bacterium]NGZ27214.1 hypothetical protein [Magnetococcales bacterium]